jgi:hypothetical protein
MRKRECVGLGLPDKTGGSAHAVAWRMERRSAWAKATKTRRVRLRWLRACVRWRERLVGWMAFEARASQYPQMQVTRWLVVCIKSNLQPELCPLVWLPAAQLAVVVYRTYVALNRWDYMNTSASCSYFGKRPGLVSLVASYAGGEGASLAEDDQGKVTFLHVDAACYSTSWRSAFYDWKAGRFCLDRPVLGCILSWTRITVKKERIHIIK